MEMAAESEAASNWEDDSPNWGMDVSIANPFGNATKLDFTVADDEFCSAEAAKEFIAEDDLAIQVVLDPEKSVRWDNEKFMDQTIGTYMAAGSDYFGNFEGDSSHSSPIWSSPLKKSPPGRMSPPSRSSLANRRSPTNKVSYLRSTQEPESWLHISTDESLPHSLPRYLENCVSDESLPTSPPVGLISMTGSEILLPDPVPDMEKTSNTTLADYTYSEMHKLLGSGDVTFSNISRLLEEVKKKSHKRGTAMDKRQQENPQREDGNKVKDVQSQASESRSVVPSPPSIDDVFKIPNKPAPKSSRQMPPPSSKSEQFVPSSGPSASIENDFALLTVSSLDDDKSERGLFPNNLLSETTEAESSFRDDSKLVCLLPETTAMSFLHDVTRTQDLITSTPMHGQKTVPWLTDASLLDHHSIHHVVTPYKQVRIFSVPEKVEIPEVCCVMLGQQVQFPVINKHKRGVKCTFTIRTAKLDGKSISVERCPFEIKRQITLQPTSEETVEVLFTPKDEGCFFATLEVFAQDFTNPTECQTLKVILQGKAEYPRIMVSPVDEMLNFGDVVWGNSSYRSFEIKNIGKATVPVRFSIFRTESSFCNFTFCSNQSCDLSTISLTPKPEGVGSVMSLSLAGHKEGDKVHTHSVKVCCQVKDMQNAEMKYSQTSEKFQAVLHIDIDLPLSNRSHLGQIKMVVAAGMFKLHTDKNRLDLCPLPNEVKLGSIKVINSGNIPMCLDLRLEPEMRCFALRASQMVLGPQVERMVEIEYRPQMSSNTGADETELIMFDQLSDYIVPVVGRTKIKRTKLSASATSLSFGGVEIGKEKTQKFTFVPDSDGRLKIWLKDANTCVAFQLFHEGIKMEPLSVLNIYKNVRHTVMVSFHPTDVKPYMQQMIVQVDNADRFTIPLTGYGGQSCLELTGVSQADSGEHFLDLGRIVHGSSSVSKMLITNRGDRNAYVKAIVYDVGRSQLSPYRATISPSRLVLEPGESKELILMFNPSEMETKLCASGRALVAIVKLLHGDEITRQLLLRSDAPQARTYALDFEIPFMSMDGSIKLPEEFGSIPPGQEMSLFKKSIKSIKIGLVAETLTPEKLPSSLPSPVITSLARAPRKNSSPTSRTALQPVNQNVEMRKKPDKGLWSVTPVDVQMMVSDSKSKEFVQIINFSNEDFRFTTECDDVLKATPSSGIVKSKNFTQLEIFPNINSWSQKEKSSCGLIKVLCAQQTQYIRVQLIFVSDILPSADSGESQHRLGGSQSSAHDSASSASCIPTKLPSACSLTPRSPSMFAGDVATHEMADIMACSEVHLPSVAPGNVSEIKYLLKNTSYSALSWSAQCEVVKLKASEGGNIHSIHQPIFSVIPMVGNLKPSESQTVKFDFSPQSSGVYSQIWRIFLLPNRDVHQFTIYGRGSGLVQHQDFVHPSSQPNMSRTKPEKDSTALPSWAPVPASAESKNSEKTVESANHKQAQVRSSKMNSESLKEVSLRNSTLHFGSVMKGEKLVENLQVINPLDRDAQMVVEQDPGPPFTIKRSQFKIGKSRMIIFPVTFTPKEPSKYAARIVMREKYSNTVLTATIDGECIL